MSRSLSEVTSAPPPETPTKIGFQDFQLRIRWFAGSTGNPAAQFAVALASYLHSDQCELVATTESGQTVNDLTLDECAAFIRRGEPCELAINSSKPLGNWKLVLSPAQGPDVAVQECIVIVASSIDRPDTEDIIWLQPDLSHLSPIPLMALPIAADGLSLAAVHNLVALAGRVGRVEAAELKRTHDAQSDDFTAMWTFIEPIDGGIPIYAQEDGAIHIAMTDPPSVNAEPIFWLIPSTESVHSEPQITKEWWDGFNEILTASDLSTSAITAYLQNLGALSFPISIVPLSELPPHRTMTPLHDGVSCLIAPTETGVCIGVDFESHQGDLAQALLHAYGHLLLGHVRAGDECGHWDTPETVTAQQPHRRWDREVREHFRPWFDMDSDRKVDSLTDCTVVEKAKLGLWRMIGEMIGENRPLHTLAERYQRAAYQRQAAQRLVAMLEDYDGAMLCDGVGLGKTYVATTLMVHYANVWKDLHKDMPDVVRTDPFRITVLSPNSVVSTWRREAIPPLSSFGVPLSTVRVISHSKLSRITNTSDILQIDSRKILSDLEHLLLSDLVIVDEAHNFRSVSAGRTKVLRDLLRIQPRKDLRRRVALLTATPINNSLDDLRQQASLLFSRPLWLADARTPDGYRRQSIKVIEDRCSKARASKGSKTDLSPLVVHGQMDARFSDAIEFRDDLDFGPNVQRIGDYLKEQDKKLKLLQTEIRTTARANQPREITEHPVRIAEELLDRIVVQRSRALCKEIERQQGSDIQLLFRPDQQTPEKLSYSDEFDGIQDVLARFLPLFDSPRDHAPSEGRAIKPLSLKVYMWHDLREGIKSITESSPVVGLQRILVLKRLESSPVSFLITLLRLLVLHAHRLHQLTDLCIDVRDEDREKILKMELDVLIGKQTERDLEKLRMLATGDASSNAKTNFLKALSKSYVSTQSAADTDDPPPKQLSLFGDEEETSPKREHLDRLWTLRESLLEDLATLFDVTPKLADIIFGRFEKSQWPRGLITNGVEDADWPLSPAWGLRLVKDAKLRSLVGRLLNARRSGQRAIVFTQFSDTIAYIESVLRACKQFTREEWQIVTRGFDLPNLKKEEVTDLLETLATVTGSTEDRDDVVNSFAPYYRIGPNHPVTDNVDETEQKRLFDEWLRSWQIAIKSPKHVLISTDVLAEGVNLQDVSLLINFDVHWNPVRMIQRAGRIDRRLNPAIENARSFPELEALAQNMHSSAPAYYYHEHPGEAPITVNMILPDELETELQLRERIATKTLAIDFTLGLEQGTGAEADWMEHYKYQGISSLNSFQRDRAIEQIASHHQLLSKSFERIGIKTEWAENLNCWIREDTSTPASPLIGRALLGRKGGTLEPFTRYLEPALVDEVPHWFWGDKEPSDSMFDGWLILDGRPENFPPTPRRDIPWHENASTPLKATHLFEAAEILSKKPHLVALPSNHIGRPLMQGGSALAAPKLGFPDDRRLIVIRDFFILQLKSFESTHGKPISWNEKGSTQRRGLSKKCTVCSHDPGMHKCCTNCKVAANGERDIEVVFGFRTMTNSQGQPYEVPQPWCRTCRTSALTPDDHETSQ